MLCCFDATIIRGWSVVVVDVPEISVITWN